MAIRELQRMQDEPGYASTWLPGTLKTTTTAIASMGPAERLPLLKDVAAANNIHLAVGVERLLLEQESTHINSQTIALLFQNIIE